MDPEKKLVNARPDIPSCTAVHPTDPTVRCAFAAGHGRIRPAGDDVWFDHGNLNGEGWSVIDHIEITTEAEVKAETETWYGVFNDARFLEPKFASGELHENLRGPLLETPIYETRNVGDALRHAQLTWEDRQAQHDEHTKVARQEARTTGAAVTRHVLDPTPVVIKTQVTTRTAWTVIPPAELRAAVGGPAVREVRL